ncbi:MAG: hypothetical protein WCT02_04275 [Candidatus Paceibacterota bacterium]
MKAINILRLFLLILIIEGVVLLCTQKIWVPKIVNGIIASEDQSDNRLSNQLHSYSQLKAGDSFAKVKRLFGSPEGDIGSGIHIFVYTLADKSRVLIGFADLKHLLYVKHVSFEGKSTDLAGSKSY